MEWGSCLRKVGWWLTTLLRGVWLGLYPADCLIELGDCCYYFTACMFHSALVDGCKRKTAFVLPMHTGKGFHYPTGKSRYSCILANEDESNESKYLKTTSISKFTRVSRWILWNLQIITWVYFLICKLPRSIIGNSGAIITYYRPSNNGL